MAAAHARQTSPLVELCRRLGTSGSALARELGVHHRSVYRWGLGQFTPAGPHLRHLTAFLVARGASVADIHEALELPVPTDRDADSDGIAHLDDLRRARGLPVPTPPASPEDTEMQITAREYLEFDDLAHWGLTDDPFADVVDPEDIYRSPRLQHIERAMLAAINQRQLVALVGDPGAGKSSVLRRIVGRANRQKAVRVIAPASLDRRRITHAALAVAILRDLTGRNTSSMSQEARSELLRSTLADQDAAGIFPVVLIDEAHLLNDTALLAIKHLWDAYTLFRQLAVLMVGQRTLERRLRTEPNLRELTGRTRLLVLPGLGADTGDYLRWRFARAGGDADAVFTPAGIDALATRGEHPLWINNLAVAAMQYARTLGDTQVDAVHVARA